MLGEILGGNLIWLIALLVAISIHEFAHAFMADYLGDPTARLEGRKTLNPLAHLDPIGTIMLLFFKFGWGKPVPVDPFNFQNPRRDQALVSLAGPASNLILAFILSVILRLMAGMVNESLLFSIFLPILFINVALAIFNLIPIGPLDGFKVVLGFLPEDLAREWQETESYGLIILLLLIFLPIRGFSLGGLVLRITSSILHLFLEPSLGMVI